MKYNSSYNDFYMKDVTNVWLFFHKVPVNCNIHLPTLNQALYIDLVKLLATREPVTNIFQQIIVILKLQPM